MDYEYFLPNLNPPMAIYKHNPHHLEKMGPIYRQVFFLITNQGFTALQEESFQQFAPFQFHEMIQNENKLLFQETNCGWIRSRLSSVIECFYAVTTPKWKPKPREVTSIFLIYKGFA